MPQKLEKKMRNLFILFGFFMFFAMASEAWACSCAGPGTPKDEFEKAKAVFSARTGDFKKNENGGAKEFVLHIDKVWKGKLPQTYKIDFSQLRSGCSYWGFKEDTEYLVYAHKSWDKSNPQGLEISMCSRTKQLGQAQIETRYLDTIVKGNDTKLIDQSLPDILIGKEPKNLRAEAARLLGWMMVHNVKNIPEGTAAALVKAAQSPEDEVKLAVAQNLGRYFLIGKLGVTGALLSLLKDDNSNIRNAATSALSIVGKGDTRVFQALVGALNMTKKEQWEDTKLYETTLTALGTSIADVARTDKEKDETVNILHDLIDRISDPYNKVSIIQRLGFQRERARKFAPKILGILKGADHYHVKQYTLNALGDIKAAEALEDIKPYLKDENCYVVKSTVEAVYKIDPKGFKEFFKTQAMPEMKARYDNCQHEFIWSLQTIAPAAKDMEPFLVEKYKNMPQGDWRKGPLKTLLDTWHKKEP